MMIEKEASLSRRKEMTPAALIRRPGVRRYVQHEARTSNESYRK